MFQCWEWFTLPALCVYVCVCMCVCVCVIFFFLSGSEHAPSHRFMPCDCAQQCPHLPNENLFWSVQSSVGTFHGCTQDLVHSEMCNPLLARSSIYAQSMYAGSCLLWNVQRSVGTFINVRSIDVRRILFTLKMCSPLLARSSMYAGSCTLSAHGACWPATMQEGDS